MNSKTLKIGTRSSKLALVQTGQALQKLAECFPSLNFKTVPFSSPGDRDLQTDLKISDPDFFTRDLDKAVISGDIDAAIHSAKDLPEELNPGLDWFWLPWCEDQRDVLVVSSKKPDAIQQALAQGIRIGSSSARREEYCRQRFPNAEILPIRGNIENRIMQLDAGKYDLLIMAAAGLNRLGLHDRISEYIPLADMTISPGQGYLAVTFRKKDRRFEIIRSLFIKPVIFAGSGPGEPDLATVACVDSLRNCDICLYDSLAPKELLANLPEHATSIFVGKRSGKHSKKQKDICDLITEYSRQGKAVCRLKGGDAGIFGRLAEEIDALNELAMTYRVVPGISSMQSAAVNTGLLLTRRGIARGFTVLTPRKMGSSDYEEVSSAEKLKFPQIYFMGKSVISQITEDLIKEAWDKSTPAAVVFAAGKIEENVAIGTIADIAEKVQKIDDKGQPGLLIIGNVADPKFLYPHNAPLADKKILVTCSENVQEKAVREIRRFGGKPIQMPMIKLVKTNNLKDVFATGDGRVTKEQPDYDYLLLTSPGAVRIFLEVTDIDLRKLPKIMTCGPGTADEFRQVGIIPDIIAEKDFGAAGLLETAAKELSAGNKILRLCSDKADEKLSCEIRKLGCEVEDQVLYSNIPQSYSNLPEFDAVIFSSGSAVKAFTDNFDNKKLVEKPVAVIGEPTLEVIHQKIADCNVVKAREATIKGIVTALAEYYVNNKLRKEFV